MLRLDGHLCLFRISLEPARLQVVPDLRSCTKSHSAAAVGLVRVAASEQPHCTWSLTAQSGLAPAAAAAPAPSADVFGLYIRSGLAHAARLQAVGVPQLGSSTALELSESNLISGGLGGVGLLTSSWLAHLRPQSRLVLLGRSGRASAGHADQLMRSSCITTMLQCDVTSAAEVAPALASRNPLLILHAGERVSMSGRSWPKISGAALHKRSG